MKFNYTAYTTVYCMKYYLITVSTKFTGLNFRFKLLYVTGFVKIDPNHTGTEIHFIAEH